MKTKILVIDNELPIRKAMVKMIEHFTTPEQYEIFEAEGVRTGIDAIQQLEPDILFLDIELDDGLAFDIFKEIKDIETQLIFTTAHNHYALKAFECSALDYLLKPVSPSLLNNALQKAKENIHKINLRGQIQILMDSVNKNQSQDQKIALKDINGIKITKIKDILYCEANGPYTTFFIENDKEITVSKNLKEFEELLGAFNFVRCHHSFLVNLAKIKSIDKTEGLIIHLENNVQIPISFRKKDEILSAIEKLYLS
ncbi:MAG: LytTR family DNA-binding domain-containing protein [Saprospiraceae bacterium]